MLLRLAMFSLSPRSLRAVLLFSLLLGQTACESKKKTDEASGAPKCESLALGAYTTPREAYGKTILPEFRSAYEKDHGAKLGVRESFLASGAQARAIIAGFEADVAALSLEPDLEKLRKAGLIAHDWKAGPHAGIVTRSAVVIGVREGNPKQIKTWQDLARPDVTVLTPNVRTSGGAMWNILAVYGAALRGHAGVPAGDKAAATALIGKILSNVKVMDRGARDSMLTFEQGVGDAIITYENEILVGRLEGKKYDYVAPSSTILIENPAAIVDTYVDKHGCRAPAQALLDFLVSEQAQRAYAKYGLRPVLTKVADETKANFAPIEDLFTIRDLGDWVDAEKVVFAEGGVYDQALAQSLKKGSL